MTEETVSINNWDTIRSELRDLGIDIQYRKAIFPLVQLKQQQSINRSDSVPIMAELKRRFSLSDEAVRIMKIPPSYYVLYNSDCDDSNSGEIAYIFPSIYYMSSGDMMVDNIMTVKEYLNMVWNI